MTGSETEEITPKEAMIRFLLNEFEFNDLTDIRLWREGYWYVIQIVDDYDWI